MLVAHSQSSQSQIFIYLKSVSLGALAQRTENGTNKQIGEQPRYFILLVYLYII